jgi:hypothetical protein
MNGMEKNGILDDGLYLSATCIFFIVHRGFSFSVLCVDYRSGSVHYYFITIGS